MASHKLSIPHDALKAFCQRWNVQELALFGSALGENFTPDSDVDLLARFQTGVGYTFKDLVAMQDELEAIFGRPVDLVDRQALQASPNYIRRKHILGSAEVIYAS